MQEGVLMLPGMMAYHMRNYLTVELFCDTSCSVRGGGHVRLQTLPGVMTLVMDMYIQALVVP